MTGFGRAQRELDGVVATCEVKTLNHKGLDTKIRLPREASSLEPQVLARIKASLERGRVDLVVDVNAPHASSFDVASVHALLSQVRVLATSLDVKQDLTAGDVLTAVLASQRTEGAPLDIDRVSPAVLLAVDEALKALVDARESEGRALAAVLAARVDAIETLRTRLVVRTGDAPSRLAEKLKARLADAPVPIDPARLAQEAAILADRVDVAEELERLAAHIQQARALLESSSPGRKLEFLCQEFLREANTLGSKCQDAPTAHLVVELKTEIERMREQVQNAE
jgi:uncharacterized protein (TIGR00255 family)